MVHWRGPSALAFLTSLLAQQDLIRETQPVELALWPTSPQAEVTSKASEPSRLDQADGAVASIID